MIPISLWLLNRHMEIPVIDSMNLSSSLQLNFLFIDSLWFTRVKPTTLKPL